MIYNTCESFASTYSKYVFVFFMQDFYSHSNWVEMGQRSIYLHLLQPEEPAVPVAKGTSHAHLWPTTLSY